jgi:hypothetical protein
MAPIPVELLRRKNSQSTARLGRIRGGFLAVALACTQNLPAKDWPAVQGMEPQPLLAHALRLEEALGFIGSALAPQDSSRLQTLLQQPITPQLVPTIESILDPYCLALAHINPEMRVKVLEGPADARLRQRGWTSFLIKIHNEAGTRAGLQVTSPNAGPLFHLSKSGPDPAPESALSPGEIDRSFLELALYQRRPLKDLLSGLPLEYAVLQLYSSDAGPREARLQFSVGQGTQDLGFRSELDLLFDCVPAVQVTLRVRDHDGQPTMASFVFSDEIDRLVDDPEPRRYRNNIRKYSEDYRQRKALAHPDGGHLYRRRSFRGVYPLPSRRLASRDEYPDFYFQPQIYRAEGEHVTLYPGRYHVSFTRGPEYLPQERIIEIAEGVDRHEETFELKRWIHLAELGWFSGDHHVHGGGCSHYESPAAGVTPESMARQARGEDLNVSCILSWGPCWNHQKTYFEGNLHATSTPANLVRYDVEVSGFPSSHAGHLCLLGLKEDDYPGTTKIDDWPSWTLPVLQWAKSQGAVAGYAHSGFGLRAIDEQPIELPNLAAARFEGPGAVEYIVTVTHDVCDFISAGDTPALRELNIWYHTLNCGYRTRISGETDFPCVYDERIGMARSYVRLGDRLDFRAFLEGIQRGASYVSDGKSHLLDFRVESCELGVGASQLNLARPGRVKVSAKVAAFLPLEQDEVGRSLAELGPLKPTVPFWHIERARCQGTRSVPVELIVNGQPVARQKIEADGVLRPIQFEVPLQISSWLALRILPSSHSNPIFVEIQGQPIRASRASARWCRQGVDRCWEMQHELIRETERPAARQAYDHARASYDRILAECVAD